MKGFVREDQWFSLCGLNCGLCTMRLGGYCPGCGGGAGNQGCAVARCSLDHGGVAYCWQCEAFPCGRYAERDAYDVLITTRNRRSDMEKARRMGPEAYGAEQRERRAMLDRLLAEHNDGRRKTLFALAANLLELEALRSVMETLEQVGEAPLEERAARAAALLGEAAERQGVVLKLRKKTGGK
ncbi:DUF3795 domain-containing protein [uncultured Oscillibacter sp.]|uniref:DUF3795 domain-containing protein n=1 Tax=uncultured Oscillibacter sp. TaxID=876091 RepID=UPI0025E84D89|nr:DUF3795 domain-containing protein [uncultured Oscillibacter sp.]